MRDEGGGQRAEGRGQRAEGREQRAEGRERRAEGREQRAKGEGRRAESGEKKGQCLNVRSSDLARTAKGFEGQFCRYAHILLTILTIIIRIFIVS